MNTDVKQNKELLLGHLGGILLLGWFMISRIRSLNREMENRNCEKRMQDGGISVSTGCVWEEHAENLEEMLKTADSYMYVEKEAYHREMVTVTEHNGV